MLSDKVAIEVQDTTVTTCYNSDSNMATENETKLALYPNELCLCLLQLNTECILHGKWMKVVKQY